MTASITRRPSSSAAPVPIIPAPIPRKRKLAEQPRVVGVLRGTANAKPPAGTRQLKVAGSGSHVSAKVVVPSVQKRTNANITAQRPNSQIRKKPTIVIPRLVARETPRKPDISIPQSTPTRILGIKAMSYGSGISITRANCKPMKQAGQTNRNNPGGETKGLAMYCGNRSPQKTVVPVNRFRILPPSIIVPKQVGKKPGKTTPSGAITPKSFNLHGVAQPRPKATARAANVILPRIGTDMLQRRPANRPNMMMVQRGMVRRRPQPPIDTFGLDLETKEDRDFIDDNVDEDEEWRRELRHVTGYDPSKYIEDSGEAAESSLSKVRAEEHLSEMLGRKEDLEEWRQIQAMGDDDDDEDEEEEDEEEE